MLQLQTITKYLGTLMEVLNPQNLSLEDGKFTLKSQNKELATISDSSIILAGTTDFTKKILAERGRIQKRSPGDFEAFCAAIKPKFLRLNHLGVAYSCDCIPDELDNIGKVAHSSGFKLYEEKSTLKYERWFYIGDNSRWEDPLFELVLSEGGEGRIDRWLPHFQIDLDTRWKFADLEKIAAATLEDRFFDFKVEIPNYGVVFCMGFLDNIGGTKIRLGIGTMLRKTDYHRKKLLKEI